MLHNQLRKPENKPSLAAQRQINHPRKEWADTERRLRQKMRIYPDASVTAGKEDEQSLNADLRLPVGGRAAEQLHDPETDAAPKPIVSIHGCDVDDDECGHLIQSR